MNMSSVDAFFGDGVSAPSDQAPPVHLFYGGALGNWCRSPFLFRTRRYGEVEFTCVEQFMMMYKALLFDRQDLADEIVFGPVSPGHYKKLGRMIKPFDKERWREPSIKIVTTGCWHKFTQNEEHAKVLLSTRGKILAEASRKDKVWGIGMYASDQGATDPSNWKGENRLGNCLMKVRDMLLR